jgi:hypothetical protein
VLKLVKKTFPPDRAIFIVTFLDFCFRLCSAMTWLHKEAVLTCVAWRHVPVSCDDTEPVVNRCCPLQLVVGGPGVAPRWPRRSPAQKVVLPLHQCRLGSLHRGVVLYRHDSAPLEGEHTDDSAEVGGPCGHSDLGRRRPQLVEAEPGIGAHTGSEHGEDVVAVVAVRSRRIGVH